MKKQNGFTLIELVLAISIIAVLIMAVGTASGVRDAARAQAAAESIRTLRTAADSYIASGSMTYTGISIDGLKTSGFLPSGFAAAGTNPWGGDYAIAPNSASSSKVDISLTSVAAGAATRLNALFANSASQTGYSGTTWTATF